MIDILPLDDPADIALLKELINEHIEASDSAYGNAILKDWPAYQGRFWKVRAKGSAAPAQKMEETATPSNTEAVAAMQK